MKITPTNYNQNQSQKPNSKPAFGAMFTKTEEFLGNVLKLEKREEILDVFKRMYADPEIAADPRDFRLWGDSWNPLKNSVSTEVEKTGDYRRRWKDDPHSEIEKVTSADADFDLNNPGTIFDAVKSLVSRRTVVQQGLKAIPEKIQALNAEGIKISIEDFGHEKFSGILPETSEVVDIVAEALRKHAGEGFDATIKYVKSLGGPMFPRDGKLELTVAVKQNGEAHCSGNNFLFLERVTPESVENLIKSVADGNASMKIFMAEQASKKMARNALAEELDAFAPKIETPVESAPVESKSLWQRIKELF